MGLRLCVECRALRCYNLEPEQVIIWSLMSQVTAGVSACASAFGHGRSPVIQKAMTTAALQLAQGDQEEPACREKLSGDPGDLKDKGGRN